MSKRVYDYADDSYDTFEDHEYASYDDEAYDMLLTMILKKANKKRKLALIKWFSEKELEEHYSIFNKKSWNYSYAKELELQNAFSLYRTDYINKLMNLIFVSDFGQVIAIGKIYLAYLDGNYNWCDGTGSYIYWTVKDLPSIPLTPDPVIPTCSLTYLGRKPHTPRRVDADAEVGSIYFVSKEVKDSKTPLPTHSTHLHPGLSLTPSINASSSTSSARPARSYWVCTYCTSHVNLASPQCPQCQKFRPVTWSCRKCTCINDDRISCQVCDWKNPELTLEKRKAIRTVAEATTDVGSWSCPFCGRHNASSSNQKPVHTMHTMCAGCNLNGEYIVF